MTGKECIEIPLASAYACSRLAGMGAGALATLLIAFPGIALDKALNRLVSTGEKYELSTYDLPAALFGSDSTATKKNLNYGGFFSKYPLGIAGEAVGTAVNAAVSTAVFLATAVMGFALEIALAATVGAVILAGAILAGLVYLVRSCVVGPDKASQECCFF